MVLVLCTLTHSHASRWDTWRETQPWLIIIRDTRGFPHWDMSKCLQWEKGLFPQVTLGFIWESLCGLKIVSQGFVWTIHSTHKQQRPEIRVCDPFFLFCRSKILILDYFHHIHHVGEKGGWHVNKGVVFWSSFCYSPPSDSLLFHLCESNCDGSLHAGIVQSLVWW